MAEREAELGWYSLLETARPSGCVLRGALLTTYEEPDDQFLVEHLLPEWLGLSRSPEAEGIERQLFFIELYRSLQRLKGRILVISSAATTQDVRGRPYPWLWNFVRHLMVGAGAKATQHAKLWILHWEAAEKEFLQVVISSANLTLSAFKEQIQGGFRVLLPLAPRGSRYRLGTWGVLPDFIDALASSCDDRQLKEHFVALLERAECPDGITFVASVPGIHSRQVLKRTPWGMLGLRHVISAGRDRVKAKVLVPYVGTWELTSLGKFCRMFGGQQRGLELTWIARSHQWANNPPRWILPTRTRDAMVQCGARFALIPAASEERDRLFHPEHLSADRRWSHAKLYYFQRGRSKGLLVTSANFSPSAWGRWTTRGSLAIESFEIGVYVEGLSWPLCDLDDCADPDLLAISENPVEPSGTTLWGLATWDGKLVQVKCWSLRPHKVTAKIVGWHNKKRAVRWRRPHGLMTARVEWTDLMEPPMFMALVAGKTSLKVPVFDSRAVDASRESPIPEVDPHIAQTLCDQMLFEEYGSDTASELLLSTESEKSRAESVQGADDYTVEDFEFARKRFEIVDAWQKRRRSAVLTDLRKLVICDGAALVGAFERLAKRLQRDKQLRRASGARLAAQELRIRLKQLRI